MSLGKLIHYSVDLVLISMLLASVRRTTGLHLIYQQSDLRKYISKYLAFGEQMYDRFVSLCRMSGYFATRRLFDRDLPTDE
ncbi:CYFA0S04e05094g1_1 [Cyberlindnera fabianii]|uniref:CYFA0S04e05094g1_1 n=1 Tax=Cyberlindnera fabianii TaxID=36022 RepID=A0A061ASM9_CYBFA|nr:CYFA0S04e05094g1_1 [Cyberlindnera fabianii]